MRHYEVMLILDPSLEDKDAKAAVDRFLTTVTSRGGTVGNIDHWGKRRFAYEIRHLEEGYYTVVDPRRRSRRSTSCRGCSSWPTM